MNPERVRRYRARFLAVLDHIEAHLDQALSTAELSTIAAFSKYHFHRQFQSFFGMSALRYVQLSRLKRASYHLAFRDRSVLDAAVSNGYESPESFARAFRREFLQTPSTFRARPDWHSWAMSLQPLTSLRDRYMPTTNLAPIQIVQFPTTKIALLEHRGDPLTIGDSIRKFIAWRKRHRLHPSASATFNLLYEDPEAVAAEQFRLGLGAATELTIEANTEGVIASEIPSARCATIRVIGSDAALAMSLQQLYCDWLPTSGEEPSDFPLFVQRVQFYPDVPEQQAVTDVFLPLR